MDVFSLMLFEENELIKKGQEVIRDVEENIRQIKVEYQRALKDYQHLKNGDEAVYEELEPKYLKLLAKLKKAINETTSLWDKSIANVEVLKQRKKEKAEYFLTGVMWSASILELEEGTKEKLIDQAKDLIN